MRCEGCVNEGDGEKDTQALLPGTQHQQDNNMNLHTWELQSMQKVRTSLSA